MKKILGSFLVVLLSFALAFGTVSVHACEGKPKKGKTECSHVKKAGCCATKNASKGEKSAKCCKTKKEGKAEKKSEECKEAKKTGKEKKPKKK